MASTAKVTTKSRKDLLLHKADLFQPEQILRLYEIINECGSYQQTISAIGTCVLHQLDEGMKYPVEEVRTIRKIVIQTRCAQGTSQLDHYTKKVYENAGE